MFILEDSGSSTVTLRSNSSVSISILQGVGFLSFLFSFILFHSISPEQNITCFPFIFISTCHVVLFRLTVAVVFQTYPFPSQFPGLYHSSQCTFILSLCTLLLLRLLIVYTKLFVNVFLQGFLRPFDFVGSIVPYHLPIFISFHLLSFLALLCVPFLACPW